MDRADFEPFSTSSPRPRYIVLEDCIVTHSHIDHLLERVLVLTKLQIIQTAIVLDCTAIDLAIEHHLLEPIRVLTKLEALLED